MGIRPTYPEPMHLGQPFPLKNCASGGSAILCSCSSFSTCCSLVTGGLRQALQWPETVGDAGRGDLYDYFAYLGARLRYVRVCCGDWSRVLGDSVTWRHGVTGILLDPPYSHDERDGELYGQDHDVAQDVQAWARENGDNPLLRIVLCGYDTEHAGLLAHGWTAHRWKSAGGFGAQGAGKGRDNAKRETLWFSPHCIPDRKLTLFDMGV